MAGGNSSTSRTSIETSMTTVSTTLLTQSSSFSQFQYVAISLSGVVLLAIVIVAAVWYNRYRKLSQTIEEMRRTRVFIDSEDETPISPSPDDSQPTQEPPAHLECSGAAARPLWSPPVPAPHFTVNDLSLLEVLKIGKQGRFYKAKLSRGTCKGHKLVTCKIVKEGISMKRVESEVSVMKKLGSHNNVLQLLDWNTSHEPYVLIMEYVSFGTLKSFLKTHRAQLSDTPELQCLLTIAAYHIALAMEHIRSKMVVHCDLGLRNILLGRFPHQCKVAEFGLARDFSRFKSRKSSRKKHNMDGVPLRWYPPEYFKSNYYSFMGDVWSFGILLWEMETFGQLPYSELQSSEEVVFNICSGYRLQRPEKCRTQIFQVMTDCWREPPTLRPSFSDIVTCLENVIENDSDYVQVAAEDNDAVFNDKYRAAKGIIPCENEAE
ncbi:tyrosine kinase receptor Cad96Ca-like [Acipenser ruthenus]|uniref:tyrosine kinase receptor Cad96Ca-like n=1 Tax=Acipenser ruthenus TaxID=7906 RepID=UPI00274156D1|nr:tyrosine kinase receptor Cad96Ca-like [Acipenser ruthenus]XP_058854008.1 tyrosine kinase receptor Cad96Ca-like [Acipenser ruthenus]